MRVAVTTVLALATAGWLAAPLSPAAADLPHITPQKASADCTILGTPGADVLRGTKKDDFICGLGGDDRIEGRGGDDVLRGGQGDDTIEGGPGDDLLSGGRGDDHLDAQDLATDRDRLRCGRGRDTTVADVRDRVRRDCENVDQDNAAPTDLSLTPAAVAENRPAGTIVGTLTATDPDAGDEHAFALVAGAGATDNGSFAVSGATLRTAASLDHEATPTLSIRVRATDALGLTIEKQLSVTVTDADDPAVAVDDTATVVEDSSFNQIDVMGNDTDTDGHNDKVASVSQPAHGSAGPSIAGADVIYVPDPDYCNGGAPTDDFTYTLSGGDVGTVHVTVTCVDDPAVAVDDTKTVGEDSTATTITVLANDADPEGDPFSVTGVGPAGHGATSFTATDVSYTPAANYCGPDTFTYTITGGDSATVSVTVTCGNDAPVAVDDTVNATEDTAQVFPAADLTGNDTDADVADVLTVTAVSNPTGGTVALVGGTVTFTPAPNLCLPTAAGFDYTLSDGTTADTGHVTVDVTCVNDPPVAVDDTRTVSEDNGSTGFLPLVNDTDVEGDPISIIDVTDPAHGSTTFNASSIVYTPDADYCGPDSFDYTVNGGDTATVSVTVTCVNDAPVVDLNGVGAGHDSSVTFNETNPHTGSGVLIAPNATVDDVDDANLESLTVVLANRPDGAAESLSATIPGGSGITGGTYVPGTGTLSFTGTASKADYAAVIASIRYDNAATPPGSVDRTITVVANDGDTDSPTSTATVHVVPLNAPPVNTVPGAQTTGEDTPLVFGAGKVISVADPDNASLGVEVQVTHGTFTLSSAAGLAVIGDGTDDVTLSGPLASLNAALLGATYTPAANYNGPALLTITSTDSLGAADSDTVDLTVTAVDDAPTATNLSAGETYTEDTALNLVDIVVSDVDSTTVTVTLTLGNPAVGALSTATAGTVTSTYVAGNGVWTASGPVADVNTLLAGVVFTPAANVNAGFSIATSVSDNLAPPVTGSKAMTGVAVNDAPTITAPASGTVDEDTDLVFSGGNLISVADIDAGASSIQVTLTTLNGTMTLSGTAGLTITGQGTGLLTASGTVANLNTALASSKFRGTQDYFGAATLAISVSDLGNTGAGGAQTDNDTVSITVNPVNDAPVADDETFNGAKRAIGNTSLVVDDPTDGAPDPAGVQKTVSGDILDGDTDVDTPLANLSVQAETKATSGGGTVAIEADGDFTYLGQQGCDDTTDSFTYTVKDNDPTSPLTDTGTVNLTSADCVWYVDASVASDPAAAVGGTSQNPFKGFLHLSGPGGAGDPDEANDSIFVSAGSYAGGFGLEAGQQLLSQRHGLSLPDGGAGTTVLAPANAGAGSSTVTGGLALAANNVIQGIDLGQNSNSAALFSSVAIGTATVNTVTSGSINNPTGGALSFTAGGTLNATFSSLSSAGSGGSTTNAIALTNINGTIQAPAGAISGTTGSAVTITGGSVDLTLAPTLTANNSSPIVSISGASGGTKDFNGAVTDGAAVGGGVSLTNNTGATIRFDGGLTVSSGTSAGFAATGGGTVVVTDPNAVGTSPDNTLTTTTGTALDVTNTTIGAAGLTFRSISAGSGATGPAKGIVLASTGSVGGLSVTGDGSTPGSGGTIRETSVRGVDATSTSSLSLKYMDFVNASKTDAGGAGVCDDLNVSSCNAVLYLNGVSTAAVLDHLSMTGTQSGAGGLTNRSSLEEGVLAVNVVGLKLDNSTLSGCGDELEEECLKARGLTGTSTITNSDLALPGAGAVEIVNGSGNLALTINGSTFRDSQSSPSGQYGVQLRGTNPGTANITLDVINSSFLRIRSVGLNVQAIGATVADVDVSGSTFDTGTGTMIGLDLSADNIGTLRFNVQNNPKVWARNGPAINVFGDTNATINGRINNNPDVRVLSNVAGSQVGSGIRANINKDATARLEVKNNTVTIGSDDAGIDLSGIGRVSANPGGGTNTLDATVTGNTVSIGSTSSYGVVILSATNAADTNAICANVASNAITRSPSSIASFRARVVSSAGFFRMQSFNINPELTWNGALNTPTSAGGSEVSFGGSGTFGTCTAALPTNPGLSP